jgi:hypothetical protein
VRQANVGHGRDEASRLCLGQGRQPGYNLLGLVLQTWLGRSEEPFSNLGLEEPSASLLRSLQSCYVPTGAAALLASGSRAMRATMRLVGLTLLAAAASSTGDEANLRGAVGAQLLWEDLPSLSLPSLPSSAPCPTGQRYYDCKPCPKQCGQTGSTMCTMACTPGCSCPSGTWTKSSVIGNKCFTTSLC